MDIINVGLYGGKGIFGGRETPLEADIIHCDKYEKCSYYKNNTCLNVRALFSSYCKFGRIQRVTGYTSRAKKYSEFREKWRNHDEYSKLRYPEKKLGLIDGYVVIPYPFINLTEKENKTVEIDMKYFSSNTSFISIESFTPHLINRICRHRPYAMMGGEIKDYQNKYVPLFLAHLKEVMLDVYESFIREFPEYEKDIDYRGRKAYLKTINPSHVLYTSVNYPKFNEKWFWDGEILTYESGYVDKVNIVKDYEVISFKIKPGDKTTIVISDNSQVNENTVFVD